MRCLIALLMLTGCTYDLALTPRGGGAQAVGTMNDGSFNMKVELAGETYTGKFVSGTALGAGLHGSAVMPVVMISNQKSALLTGPFGTLRCDFAFRSPVGGNGVCADSRGTVYDLLIK